MDEIYHSGEVCPSKERSSGHRATERERVIYGERVEIVSRDSDKTVYRIKESDGDVVMTSYRVFDGIDLIYNDMLGSAWITVNELYFLFCDWSVRTEI